MTLARQILTALVYAYTVCIMFGMGASIDVDLFQEIRRAPKAVACGVASQYAFMPLITFLLISAFDLGDTEALTLMLCGMCPGGVTSTFFTYISRANVTLSLVMTTCSTFLALGMMPLLVFVYVRPPLVSSGSKHARLNYLAIVVTLVVATTPALLGWRLRRARPTAGERAEKWSTVVGAICLIGALVCSLAGTRVTMTASAVAVMALMCPVGFVLGYAFATAAGLDAVSARTVSLETGIQQVGIAGAIAINTFKDDALDRAIAVVVVFGCFTVAFGLLWSGVLRYTSADALPAEPTDPSKKMAPFPTKSGIEDEEKADPVPVKVSG